MSDELIDQIRDDLARKRAEVQARLNEIFVGEPCTEDRIRMIRDSLPEGWTLTGWEMVDGELNIAVTGPPQPRLEGIIVRHERPHLSVVQDPEEG